MCTNQWMDIFPYAKTVHLDREWSDHAPIKLIFDKRMTGVEVRRSFKFEQAWLGEEGCEDAVWRGVSKGGGGLGEALKNCARELQAWKKNGIRKIGYLVERKSKQLSRLNDGDRSEEEVRKRKKLVAEIATLRRQEEQYWRQRSRALWLEEGDRNTKFFHTRAGERKRKNHISMLIDDAGMQRMGNEEVAGVANSYFRELFTSSQPANFDDTLVGMENRVLDRMNLLLRAEYREEEVIEALNQMHPLKAPGPDGMNGLFFQSFWHLIGKDVVGTVLAILRGELSPAEFNKTNIVLIPKKKAPDKIRDFRPISLCNVVYKLVSKVLANRLKTFLPEIVSENQSAFTPGRLITDNVLVAFEMFHHLKNSRQLDGFMALKLDMAKAYDRVEWNFLRRVLEVMNFDQGWINRVMACVSSVSFSVLINGSPSEEFKPERGLRQGDPLSPYLFILCAEAFSNLLRRAVAEEALHGLKISNEAPAISHLFFADDSILFVRATEGEANTVNSILRKYEEASGQLVSLDKTTVSFSKGVPGPVRNQVANRLGVREVEVHERYLGLPTVVGRSKKVITNIIRDKLCKRLHGWRGKILSRAGREVLIKAVANSLPTYVMSVFKIPASFCNELRSMVSRFWWGHGEGSRGISWVSWKKMCRPKAVGGLGFRDFEAFNDALLAKQAWRLVTETNCLWARVMKARYYPRSDFMEANIGARPSYTWRGILGARVTLERGLRRRIGNGQDTLVWGQPWLYGNERGKVISPCQPGYDGVRVADLFQPGNAGWDVEKLHHLFMPFEVQRILNIRVSPNLPRDDWFWCLEKSGEFSVKTAYACLIEDQNNMGGPSNWERERWMWNRLWKISVWPRVKIFFWQLCSGALATLENIVSRVKGELHPTCYLCSYFSESCLHLFRDCSVAQWVWNEIGLSWEDGGCGGGEVRDWIEYMWKGMNATDYGKFMVGCWALWEFRNKVAFEGAKIEPARIVQRIWDVVNEGTEVNDRARGKVERRTVREKDSGYDGWKPAPEGWVKINVDAGVKEGNGVHTGVVCRGGQGEVLWGISWVREVDWEPRFAEAIAVLDGLQEAREWGHRNVVLESDCLQVVEDLQEGTKGRSDLSLVLDDISLLCNEFESVIWSFTGRANNSVAHALAHVEPRVVGKTCWLSDLPAAARFAASFDLSLMN
ncbi:uncharacterized protein LOC141641928 [Silene latifolia]|uniref:uncharacterized protein LOC141641928 n=1 Tax=Silene latifolia TaxID=37657 RepID=UPI003D7844AC